VIDQRKTPIQPNEYEKKLAGATVLVRVSLSCDVLPRGHQFYADVVSISVLSAPEVPASVVRRQFPVTPAYAFTDYRSQGQTLSHVIIDLATPPSGCLSLFNIYVALSRSHRRDHIRLLHAFDDELFTKTFDADLIREDEQLEELDKTQQRHDTGSQAACK
jgi:hypothetical protein